MKETRKLVPAIQPLQISGYAIRQGYAAWNIPPLGEADPVFTLKSGTRVVGRRILDNTFPPRPIVETTTHLGAAPTALVYGDSFSYVMEPFFNETFRRTITVPTAHWPFPSELIERERPDVVILEIVERHLAQRPPVSEAVENEYLLRDAPSLAEAIARSSGIGGYVGAADESGGKIDFVGAAVDHAPAKLALAYYDTRPVGVARMSPVRLEVAPSKHVQKLGFRLSIPLNLALDDPAQLRFFSTTPDRKIYELAITPTLRLQLARMFASSRPATPRGTADQDRR